MLTTRVTFANEPTDSLALPHSLAAAKPSGAIPISYNQIGAVLAVADFILIIATGLLSGEIYNYIVFNSISNVDTYTLLGIASAAAFVIVSHFQGQYRTSAILKARSVVKTIAASWTISTGSLLLVAFLGKVSADYSRGGAVTFFVSTVLVLSAYRLAAQRGLKFLIVNGHLNNRRHILLVGSAGQLADREVFNDLRRHGYGIGDEIIIHPTAGEAAVQARTVSAAIERLKHYVSQNRVDEIFLAFDGPDGRTFELVVEQLRSVPIPVRMLFDQRLSALLSVKLTDLGAAKAVRLQSGPLTEGQQAFKRVQDIVLSLAGLLLFAPVFAIIALAISLDSPGPVLFRQRRAGFSGRLFRIYKFRSMNTLDDGAVVKQATRNDMRVTRVGRFLRKTSLDELPQLLNVLRGDMSLVGPRPHALSHDNEYNQRIATYAMRHHMKPGITGWAQVNGFRGETSTLEMMEKRVEHDLWYIGHWTILLDVKIVLLTIFQVIWPRDVY